MRRWSYGGRVVVALCKKRKRARSQVACVESFSKHQRLQMLLGNLAGGTHVGGETNSCPTTMISARRTQLQLFGRPCLPARRILFCLFRLHLQIFD
jgi:hypothetical protein